MCRFDAFLGDGPMIAPTGRLISRSGVAGLASLSWSRVRSVFALPSSVGPKG